MIICTALDDQRGWLASGQVLSALWLRATRDGLSLVPLSQVVEVPGPGTHCTTTSWPAWPTRRFFCGSAGRKSAVPRSPLPRGDL